MLKRASPRCACGRLPPKTTPSRRATCRTVMATPISPPVSSTTTRPGVKSTDRSRRSARRCDLRASRRLSSRQWCGDLRSEVIRETAVACIGQLDRPTHLRACHGRCRKGCSRNHRHGNRPEYARGIMSWPAGSSASYANRHCRDRQRHVTRRARSSSAAVGHRPASRGLWRRQASRCARQQRFARSCGWRAPSPASRSCSIEIADCRWGQNDGSLSLLAHIDATLEKQIFDISQHLREAHVHHHHQANHLRRRVELAERVRWLA